MFRQTTIVECSAVFVLAGVVRLELTARGFGDRGTNTLKTADLRRFRGRVNYEILQYILLSDCKM